MKSLSIFDSKEFIRFMLVGISAAIVNFFSRILINYVFSYSVSIVLAYILGMIVAFILNKWLVFETADKRTTRQIAIFIIVNLIAVLQTYIISIILVNWLFPKINFIFYTHEIAHMVGISVPIITSYIGHKYFTFK